jgi:Na+/H+ antiporter NhaD/arsenite permease-like protein
MRYFIYSSSIQLQCEMKSKKKLPLKIYIKQNDHENTPQNIKCISTFVFTITFFLVFLFAYLHISPWQISQVWRYSDSYTKEKARRAFIYRFDAHVYLVKRVLFFLHTIFVLIYYDYYNTSCLKKENVWRCRLW